MIPTLGVWTGEERISDMNINRDVYKQVGKKELGRIYWRETD